MGLPRPTRRRQPVAGLFRCEISRVTFHLPAIHCVACVWLLENLFRLHSAIGRSQANFSRREVGISFATGAIALERIGALCWLRWVIRRN